MEFVRKAKKALKKGNDKENEPVLLVQYKRLNYATDEFETVFEHCANKEPTEPLDDTAFEQPDPVPKPRPRRRSVLKAGNQIQPQPTLCARKLQNDENQNPRNEQTQQENKMALALDEKPLAKNVLGPSNNILTESGAGSPKTKPKSLDDPSGWPIGEKIKWFDKS